jgi:hypothetical protein
LPGRSRKGPGQNQKSFSRSFLLFSPEEEGSFLDDGEQSLRIFKEIIIPKIPLGRKKFLPDPQGSVKVF